MRVARLAGLFWLLVLCAALFGCGGSGAGNGFNGRYEEITLDEAPAGLKAQFEQMKGVPGLFVIHQGDETYLLLTAGRASVPGRRLELVDLRKPTQTAQEARLTVSLQPAPETPEYWYLLLRLQAPAGTQFVARIPQGEGQLELRGTPIANRSPGALP